MMNGKPEHIALLCNPLAASGKSMLLAAEINALLHAKQIPVQLFSENWPEHFTGFTDVFIVGGDGTLNYFVNRYPEINIPLTVFKGGTGNDFHWMLYGNTTLAEQLHMVLNAAPRPVDMGKCNNRYFLNEAGIGFEGAVVKALTGKKKRPGKASFMLTVLKKIFSYPSSFYTISMNNNTYTGKKLLVDVSNGCRAGGGFHIAPESKPYDGLFDVVMANALSPLQRLRFLPVMEKGKHLKLPFIQHIRTSRLMVESGSAIQYHLDGEYFEAEELDIELLPGKLMFRY